MEREKGFYWIKQFNREWTIGEWMTGAKFWLLTGDDTPTDDSELLEIDSEPIKRNN